MNMLQRLKQLAQRRIAKDASWMLFGQGSNFFLRAAYFFLLARLLGAVEFGIFAGVWALVNVVAPYSALGSGLLFMRYVSKDRRVAPVYWGNALLTSAGMTGLITAIFIYLGPLITGIHSLPLIVTTIVANCIFTKTLDVASNVYRTYGKLHLSAGMSMFSNASRVIVVGVMWVTMHHATAVQWAFGVLISTGLTTFVTLFMVQSLVKGLEFDLRMIRRQFWEGLTYTFSSTSQAVYNDLDKTLLTHYGMTLQNGFYTLAYRIIDFSFTPIAAIDLATLPRLFNLSHHNPKKVGYLGFRAAGVAVAIGAVMSVVLWGIAPLVPHLFGPDFGNVVYAVRWLAFIPLLRGIHLVLGSTLTATGRQSLRVGSQFGVAILNVVLNIWLIPTHGWRGAAWSSLISDGTLAIVILILVSVISKRSWSRAEPVAVAG
jgi:O-antigen/teichoic acid export membrane protein